MSLGEVVIAVLNRIVGSEGDDAHQRNRVNGRDAACLMFSSCFYCG